MERDQLKFTKLPKNLRHYSVVKTLKCLKCLGHVLEKLICRVERCIRSPFYSLEQQKKNNTHSTKVKTKKTRNIRLLLCTIY